MKHHIVAMPFGNVALSRPFAATAALTSNHAWANSSGFVLYPDASQPSARRPTRLSPAGEPQLPIQI